MLMRKSNHPQLLRAAVSVQPMHLHFLTARKTTTRDFLWGKHDTICAMWLCSTKSAAQVSVHHGATGENGLEMNRYPLLCLKSEGRGGGDGWDSIHAFLQSKERKWKTYKHWCNSEALKRDYFMLCNCLYNLSRVLTQYALLYLLMTVTLRPTTRC